MGKPGTRFNHIDSRGTRTNCVRPMARAPDPAAFFARLQAATPEPKGELDYVNPYTLLVAVVLSAQATDVGVNRATRQLFQTVDHPAKMVASARPASRSTSRPSASTTPRPRTSSGCRSC